MTSSRAYIAACGYCLPLVVGAAVVAWGLEGGLATAVACVATLVHLVSSERILRRIHHAAGHGLPAPRLTASLRFALTLPLALGLAAWLGAAPTLAGLSSLALGLVVVATASVLRSFDVTLVARPLETLG